MGIHHHSILVVLHTKGTLFTFPQGTHGTLVVIVIYVYSAHIFSLDNSRSYLFIMLLLFLDLFTQHPQMYAIPPTLHIVYLLHLV